MTIGALARAGGVGVETVRYYQRRGLMPEPPRPEGPGLGGGVRRYRQDELRRLLFIRSAKSAGFTLDEIGALLVLDASHDRGRVHDMARSRLRALDAKITELAEARAALIRLADACASGGTGPCPIIAAFQS